MGEGQPGFVRWLEKPEGVDAHLRGSIDVQHQRFILRNHKPCLVPSFPTLLHVVQEAADDAVLSSH